VSSTRSDLEVLLLPLLQMLYTAAGRAPSHLYMLLIILLILTQDASFAANVHRVQLAAVPWYRERLLTKTSLGALSFRLMPHPMLAGHPFARSATSQYRPVFAFTFPCLQPLIRLALRPVSHLKRLLMPCHLMVTASHMN
jgi:hypothetical protein